MLEQFWRRRSAAATMAATRRSQAGQPESGRIIKMEPTRSTGAARDRNRAERDSPVAEKKNSASVRNWGNSKSTPPCRRQGKESEG